MTEEQVVDWIMTQLKKNSYTEGSELARQFCREFQIKKANDPHFNQFMNVSMRLAGEIALLT